MNGAAKLAQELLSSTASRHTRPFVLSVGSTPTAHAFSEPSNEVLDQLKTELHGKLELHAGNYPVLDLQQLHTSLVSPERVSHRILASIISYYPGRSEDGGDEAMCDAGAIALSKDTGPSGGFGDVVGDIGKGWKLGRVSQVSLKRRAVRLVSQFTIQEHGVLVRKSPVIRDTKEGLTDGDDGDRLKLGSIVQLVAQHACLTAANHPWYYITDSDMEGGAEKVVDIWVPWKGW